MAHRLSIALITVALGAIAVASVPRLWPLVPAELSVDTGRLEEPARRFLRKMGCKNDGLTINRRVEVASAAIDSLPPAERGVLEQLASEAALARYVARFVDQGGRSNCHVELSDAGEILGWRVESTGRRPQLAADPDAVATSELAESMRLDLSRYTLSASDRVPRSDGAVHRVVFSRTLRANLRDTIVATVAGTRVIAASRRLLPATGYVPPARSNYDVLAIPIALVSLCACLAFVVFFSRFLVGDIRWSTIAPWPIASLVCVTGALLFESSNVFPGSATALEWAARVAQDLWLPILILLVAGAADAVARDASAGSADVLWLFGKGRVWDERVGRAAAMSVPVTLICGGVFAIAVHGLAASADAEIQVQPRGVMLMTVNLAWPCVSSLLTYASIAIAEELGYRFFLGRLIDHRLRSRALAIVLPALLFGAMHSGQDALPPVDPVWGRALVMTLVGVVWGWAYFRYGALTVVLSHLTADLFIALWPRLASGDPAVVLPAAITVALPCAPAIGWAVRAVRERPAASPDSDQPQ